MGYICNREKYTLGGSRKNTISLPVRLSGLPETLEVEEYTLQIRSTFHVSLVCVGEIIKKTGKNVPGLLDKIVQDFCEFSEKNPIDFLKYLDEFRFAWENERRTVVVRCEISNLNKFFDLINEKYNLGADYPPTHVTLYTLEKDKGIFLTDSKDIETMTKLIKNPGLELR